MAHKKRTRREFISSSAALAGALALSPVRVLAQPNAAGNALKTTSWPSAKAWEALQQQVGGRLIRPTAPWATLKPGAVPPELTNPWFLEEQPGATQSTGMYQAWDSTPSEYAVAVESVSDIIAAVKFAKEHHVRLVVKGTGHDYFGRSSAPNSLLVWTHKYRGVTVHDAFKPLGAPEETKAVRAVNVKAGNRWLEAYQAATAANCYIQGGGCTSVGACGGFALGGGFGSYSKKFGSGAGGVLELEVVTADGSVLVANAFQNADLFWALRGGGGGTFGIVSRMTLLAHPIPTTDGWLSGSITASSDEAYQELIQRYFEFVATSLNNGNWGEGVIFVTGKNEIDVGTAFLDLTAEQAQKVWEPFLAPLRERPADFSVKLNYRVVPFKDKWNPKLGGAVMDTRPGVPEGYFWWKGNASEVGAYWANYQGRGIPSSAMEPSNTRKLAQAIFQATRTSLVLFQTNKGLAGAPAEAHERDRTTSMNPAVFKNVGFVTLGSWVQCKYAGVAGHEPDLAWAATEALGVDQAMAFIKSATPGGASYTNEGHFGEANWQSEFWGSNYPRLLNIKRKYDPTNLFRVHHGVGSDALS